MFARRWLGFTALALCLLSHTAADCFGIASTDHLAGPGQKVAAQPSWPKGVAEFVNDPARTDAWHPWFSELPNDVNDYQFRAASVAELNALVERFARIESDKLRIVLSPEPPPDRIPFTQQLADGQRQPVLFQIGNQRILDRWFAHLQPDADGRRTFGVHRYDRAPTALPPTLMIYTQHPAVDLEQLAIPANVDVTASRLAPGASDATQSRHAAIEQFLKARRPASPAKSGFLWDRRQPLAPVANR